MLGRIRQLSSAECRGGAAGMVCCIRRYRRLVVQSLVIFVLVVSVTVLLSSHHRRSATSAGPISATLRRLVRSVQAALDSSRVIVGDDGSSGYLLATSVNGSRLTDVEFRSYGDAVDLRLLVLAYNRPESLGACLESLEAAEYGEEDRVALHVWIDGCPENSEEQQKKIYVAQSFNFSHGAYHVHVRSQHVGVQVCTLYSMQRWQSYCAN